MSDNQAHIAHLFYASELRAVEGDSYTLAEEESKHCLRVLRLNQGDLIHLTDGEGSLYEAELTALAAKRCTVCIRQCWRDYGARPYYLHLAVAPTKSPERYEWMVEKATEMGFDALTPFISAHSERRSGGKTERVKRVAVAAMKQSLKAALPRIHEPISLEALLRQPFEGHKFIAHCQEGKRQDLEVVLSEIAATVGPGAPPRFLILIGPEGDFSPQEVALAQAQGFVPVHLGPSRLRTETAGVLAVTLIYAKTASWHATLGESQRISPSRGQNCS